MDIYHVSIFAFLTAAIVPLPVTPEDGCLPCSQFKCPPLSSDCKDATVLDRCGCCNICIPEAIKACAKELQNSSDPLCKQIHSLHKYYFSGAHKRNLLLLKKSEDLAYNFTNKTYAENAYRISNNIINDKLYEKNIMNERRKRYLQPEPFVDWGQRIGGAFGGAFGEALASVANTAIDTPMKAKMDGDIHFQNLPHIRSSDSDELRHHKNDVSNRMFGELMTDIASGIGSSVAGVLGNVFSSVLQVPMKGHAQGQVQLENRPNRVPGNNNKAVVGNKNQQKRSISVANNISQIPQLPFQLSGNEGSFRYKRQSENHPHQQGRTFLSISHILHQVLGFIRNCIHGIIRGVFNTIIGNNAVSSMTSENLANQQDRSILSISHILHRVLSFIRNCIHGIIRGVFNRIMGNNVVSSMTNENQQDRSILSISHILHRVLSFIRNCIHGIIRGVFNRIMGNNAVSSMTNENLANQQDRSILSISHILHRVLSFIRNCIRGVFNRIIGNNAVSSMTSENLANQQDRSILSISHILHQMLSFIRNCIRAVFNRIIGNNAVSSMTSENLANQQDRSILSISHILHRVLSFVRNCIHGIIRGVFNRIMGNNAVSSMTNENLANQQDRSNLSISHILHRMLSYIRNCIHGVIRGIFNRITGNNPVSTMNNETLPNQKNRSLLSISHILHQVLSYIRDCIHSIIRGIFNRITGNTAMSSMNSENNPNQQNRSLLSISHILHRVLSYIRDCIHGIIRGIFNRITGNTALSSMNSENHPNQQNRSLLSISHILRVLSYIRDCIYGIIRGIFNRIIGNTAVSSMNSENHPNQRNRSFLSISHILHRVLSYIRNCIHGIIRGIFNRITGNTAVSPMNSETLPNQQDRTLWSILHIIPRVLSYIRSGIFGVLRGVFVCVTESVTQIPTDEDTEEDFPTENKEVAGFIQIRSRGWGEQIGRTMCHVTIDAMKLLKNFLLGLIFPDTTNVSEQYGTLSWKESQNSNKRSANLFGSTLSYIANRIASIIFNSISRAFSYIIQPTFPDENSQWHETYRSFEKKKPIPFISSRSRRSLDVMKDNTKDNFKISYSTKNANMRSKRSVQDRMSFDWGEEIMKLLGSIIKGIFRTIVDIIGMLWSTDKTLAFHENITARNGLVSGFIGNTIGSSIASVVRNIFGSIMQTPMKGKAQGNIYAENRPQTTYRRYRTSGLNIFRRKRSFSIDDTNRDDSTSMMKEAKYEKPIKADVSLNTSNTTQNLKSFPLTINKTAIKVFIEIFNAGIKNMHTDLIATNLMKRATEGDLVLHVQQLSDALLVNNAELLSYITSNILLHIKNISSNLGSQSLIRAKFLENGTELSEDGMKARKVAMIAIHAFNTPNTLHDIEHLLNTVQSDTELLLKKLFKTEIFKAVFTTELSQVISEVTIPFIKFLGDVFREYIQIFMESVNNDGWNVKHSQNAILPHVNTSMVHALLERLIVVTDSSVAESVYHITKTLLQQEIANISELIRDDEFLRSVINIKYLSLIPTLANTFGNIIVEKIAYTFKIISLTIHELVLHMKTNGITSNYTSEIVPKIQNIHKAAVLVQQFLDDAGKGTENILIELLQDEFTRNSITTDVNNFLLKKAYSVRGKIAKILGFLIEILLELLDHEITGNKQHILEKFGDFLSEDFIITFKAALNSLNSKLNNQNTQELKNAANKFGLLGAKALEKLTSNSLTKTVLNTRFVEYLSAVLHLYKKTINKFISHAIYKALDKLQHKYINRIDISDIKTKHMDMINDIVRKFTSQKYTENLKKMVKLTVLNVGTLISSLLRSELVNHVIHNKTAIELSQFVLQSSHPLGELLSDAVEQVLDAIHSIAGGERQTKIHRIRRSSENLIHTISEIAQLGFNIILAAINHLTSPQIVGFINNVIIILSKALVKIIIDVTNTDFVKRYVNQNVLKIMVALAALLEKDVGPMMGAATTVVLNHIHTLTSNLSSQIKIPWDKISTMARNGFVLIGKLAKSVSSPENVRLMRDFIKILSEGLADITHDVLSSNLMKRMVGTKIAVSLATIIKPIVNTTGYLGARLLESSMHLLHDILTEFGFRDGISHRMNMGNILPKINKLMQPLISFIKRITAPEVVQDIVEVINIITVQGAQLVERLIKSELGILLLKPDLAEAAASFAKSMGQSGGKLVSLLVQRTLNFIHTFISNPQFISLSEVSTRIGLDDVSTTLRKVSLNLIDFLLKICNDRTIASLKSLIRIVFQGIATSIGSIINSIVGHQFLNPDFAAALEKILVSVGRSGGNIGAAIIGRSLELFTFAAEKLRNYLSKEVGTRMMLGDIFNTIKRGIIFLTNPKIANDLEDMILMIGRESGSLLSKIFVGSFVGNLLNKQLAEDLARAAPTITTVFAQIIAFVVKGIVNLIHSIFTGQGISNRSFPIMLEERMVPLYPMIKGIFGVIFKIIKGLSSPNNARAITNFMVLVGKGLGNLMKEILQSDLAHTILNPTFAEHLANIAVYVGNKGGELLSYLMHQTLMVANKILGTEVGTLRSSGLTFKTIAQKLLQVAQNVLRKLTNSHAANLLKQLIQSTFRDLGILIAKVLRSNFARNILNAQLATHAADLILKISQTAGEFFGEIVKDLLNIIYRWLSQTNHDIMRVKRSTQEFSQWQILSAAAMKGLRFLQKSLEYLTKPEVVARLKNTIINTGNKVGFLIAVAAQSKYALLIFNKQLSQAIAGFAKAVGDLGGKLLGETIATALNHIHELISFSTRRDISSRSGFSWYKISPAGFQALEFIGKVLSYISSPEMTKLMKDFFTILSSELAELVHEIFHSKLAQRMVGMNFAITLSNILKEIVNQLGDIGTLLLEKVMDLIHTILAKFGVGNIKIDEILPPDLLQSLAQIAQKITKPDVAHDIVELVQLICRRVTNLLVMLIQSNLASKFLSPGLISLLANTATILGTSGGRLASLYVEKTLNFINSILSIGGLSVRSMNQPSARTHFNNIASRIKRIFLHLLALFLKLFDNNSIDKVNILLQLGIERGIKLIALLLNSRLAHSFLNPSFAKQLQYIITNIGKYTANVIAEIVAKLLHILVFLARNIKESLTEVHSRNMLPWQAHNMQRSSLHYGRPQTIYL